MPTATLVLDGTVGYALAALYVYLGTLVRARPVAGREARVANAAFAAWWLALAGFMALTASRSLLGAFDVTDRGLHASLMFLSFAPLFLAIASLLQYLVYVHTGTLRYHRAILYAHVALAAFVFSLIVWRHPLSVELRPWNTVFVYERAPHPAVATLTLLAIVAPVLVANLAYLALAFRTSDPLARFRVLTVSAGFIIWFGSAGVANLAGLADETWWPIAARALALLAGLLALFAFRPPARLARRLEARRTQAGLDNVAGQPPHGGRMP